MFCGVSMKDKHREDNIHTDHEKDELQDTPIIKVLGILNSDWNHISDDLMDLNMEITFIN